MQKQIVKNLNLDINYNNKLFCFNFIVILDGEPDFDLKETIQIKIGNSHFCYARCLKKQTMSLDDIVSNGLYLLDRGGNEKDYKNLWCNNFKKNSFKKELTILYFEKITPLTVFD